MEEPSGSKPFQADDEHYLGDSSGPTEYASHFRTCKRDCDYSFTSRGSPDPRQDLELIQDTTVAAHMAPLARQWASGSATTGGEEIEVNPEREDVVEEEDAEEEAEPEGQQTSSMLEQQFRNMPTAEELFGSDVPSESSQAEGEVTQGSCYIRIPESIQNILIVK